MYVVLPLWLQLKRTGPSISDGSGSIPNGFSKLQTIPNGLSKLQTYRQQYITQRRHSRMENKNALCCVVYLFGLRINKLENHSREVV